MTEKFYETNKNFGNLLTRVAQCRLTIPTFKMVKESAMTTNILADIFSTIIVV